MGQLDRERCLVAVQLRPYQADFAERFLRDVGDADLPSFIRSLDAIITGNETIT